MFGKKSGINQFRQEILNYGVQTAAHFDVDIKIPKAMRESVLTSSSTGGTNWFDPPTNFVQDQERRLETVTTIGNVGNTPDIRKINLRCEAATMPDISISTVRNLRYGRGTPDIVPYAPVYYEPTLTFIGDQEGDVYRFFTNWINSIQRVNENTINGILSDDLYEVGYKKDIVSDDITINTYSQSKSKVNSIRMFNAFPSSIFQTGLNWALGTEMVRFTVVFSYKDYKVL